MKFAHRLKGDMAQAIVRSIFLQARYRVIDFGVEKTVRELSSLSWNAFDAMRKMGLNGPEPDVRNDHRALSAMPDFVVMDQAQSRLSFVEVKYRTTLDDRRERDKGGLIDTLSKQARRFGEIIVVLLHGDQAELSFDDEYAMSDFLRCFVIRDGVGPPGGDPNVPLQIICRDGVPIDLASFDGSMVGLWNEAMPLLRLFPELDAGLKTADLRERTGCVRSAVRGLRAISAAGVQLAAKIPSNAA